VGLEDIIPDISNTVEAFNIDVPASCARNVARASVCSTFSDGHGD